MNDAPKVKIRRRPLKAAPPLKQEAAEKPAKPLSQRQKRLIEASVEILEKPPSLQDAAFIARQLVQATLPHADPGDVDVWMRRDGDARLMIRRGVDLETGRPLGLPYGSIPRLLLYWITTEALRTRSRQIRLGRSLNEFMREVGLSPGTGGGERSDAARVRAQMIRLFSASITFGVLSKSGEKTEGLQRVDMQIATRQSLWWSRADDGKPLQDSEITLGEDFYNAITEAPVPLDIRALASLKRSPLALDLYAWCAWNAWRARQTGESRWITWERLAKALGSDYVDDKEFARNARKELAKVQAHFPGLLLGKKRGCLEILPASSPPIQARPAVEKEGG